MSNFSKNPPWARDRNADISGLQGHTQGGQGGFTHQQSGGMSTPSGLGVSNQMTAVGYPMPRSSAALPNTTVSGALKQRVFTGVVTKLMDNFGFVDEDVFFQLSCVKGQAPKFGDRVLVEASYSLNMPFKWNATRIQVLPAQQQQGNQSGSSYNSSQNSMQQTGLYQNTGGGLNQAAVAMAAALQSVGMIPGLMQQTIPMGRMMHQQMSVAKRPDSSILGERGDGRMRDTSWDRPDRRRPRKRSRSPRKSKSPKRKSRSPRKSHSPSVRDRSSSVRKQRQSSHSAPVRGYNVHIPKISLDMKNASVITLRSRYTNLYIPSDFFNASAQWTNAFPVSKSYELGHACNFHIMSKEAHSPTELPETSSTDPPDADHRYSAKVMLLSCPVLPDLYQKSCSLAQDPSDIRDSFQHPSRLIQFLVGLKNKTEPMTIGGLWSPSLDGSDPMNDPSVLINTAIRTTRSLTGIDLSKCTQWYRFTEICYFRTEETRKGRIIPAHVETVVIFLPDVWTCVPPLLDWPQILTNYRKQMDAETESLDDGDEADTAADLKDQEDMNIDVDSATVELSKEPTHCTLLDPKSMKVSHLRHELQCRDLPINGLKTQLAARLSKAIKQEQVQDDVNKAKLLGGGVSVVTPTLEVQKEIEETKEKEKDIADKKCIEEEVHARERKKQTLECVNALPNSPCIVVHPSATAKGGKFDCSVMSLSLLLDYRPEDNKEHSFEISLFAEMFNEMLMRDFGFRIYKMLERTPDKVQEIKEKEVAAKKIKFETSDSSDKNGDTLKSETNDRELQNNMEDLKKTTNEIETDNSNKSESICTKKAEDLESEMSIIKDLDDEDTDRRHDSISESLRKDNGINVTTDPELLLACVYFDLTHAGYIQEKDVEDILDIIGLHLSRSQVKKLLAKVLSKDKFNYRKLTDNVIQDTSGASVVDSTINQQSQLINERPFAQGNRHLLKAMKKESSSDLNELKGTVEASEKSGVVLHNGCLVDIDNILDKLNKNEAARLAMEAKLLQVQQEANMLKSNYNSSTESKRLAVLELQDTKKKLKDEIRLTNQSELNTKKYREMLSLAATKLTILSGEISQTLSLPPPILSPITASDENGKVITSETKSVPLNGD